MEKKTKEDSAPTKYTPPTVQRNQIVLWYPHGQRRMGSALAVVQAVGQRTLDLAVLRQTDRFFTQFFAVPHVDDPDETDPERRAHDGGWELAPPALVNSAPRGYVEVTERVEVLERRVARLIEKFGASETPGAGEKKG